MENGQGHAAAGVAALRRNFEYSIVIRVVCERMDVKKTHRDTSSGVPCHANQASWRIAKGINPTTCNVCVLRQSTRITRIIETMSTQQTTR